MAKFYGEVGYATKTESAPGVHRDVITEKTYMGEIIQNSRRLQEDDKLNKDVVLSNSVSIVADAYANLNFFAIRYVRWMGVLWTVTNVQVQRPRLILRLGEVYNGPTP